VNDHIGFFVTLSAYGNRLHGDERGTVDSNHNAYDSPPVETNPLRVRYERERMRAAPVTFDEAQRGVVEAAVLAVCEFRGWTWYACHCRTNHLHAVVGTSDIRNNVIRVIKDRTTRALRESGLLRPDRPAWARGASARYLWTDEDIGLASAYTIEGQGDFLRGTRYWREFKQE
jgi:hypothetical protein